MRIFVKKRMRSHGMPMVFQIGSLALLTTKTERSMRLRPEGSSYTKVIPLGLADITRGLLFLNQQHLRRFNKIR